MAYSDNYPAKRFGRYQVVDIIGSGGMGTVYRARDSRLEREVALKVLRRNLSVTRARDRFMREARAVSSLSHPNICTLFDIGEQDGDPFLVLELLRGESLKDRIGRGPLDAEDIREFAFRVGSALQAAHQRGIVHRDIKPANLFLINDGHGSTDVKVLDFGLAKVIDERDGVDESEGITRFGSTVGTVEYMSPEQARGQVLDARSDLFSLGAVLYEMATGRLPFRGSTSAVVFSELLNENPVPPREANLSVPADLDRIIRELLVKERRERLQSASALLDLLAGSEGGQRTSEISRVPPPLQDWGGREASLRSSSTFVWDDAAASATGNRGAAFDLSSAQVRRAGPAGQGDGAGRGDGAERGDGAKRAEGEGSVEVERRSQRRSGRRKAPLAWPKTRTHGFGNEGDFSDPIAGSGERRLAVLAESSRPVPKVMFVDDEPHPISSADQETEKPVASSGISSGHILVLALAAALIVLSLLLIRYRF